jgi:hypothetical protein
MYIRNQFQASKKQQQANARYSAGGITLLFLFALFPTTQLQTLMQGAGNGIRK